jgi:hypothetical protein
LSVSALLFQSLLLHLIGHLLGLFQVLVRRFHIGLGR